MTDVTSDTESEKAPASGTSAVDDGLVAELVARAQAGGVKLTGEGGLLQQLTKRVLESALEGQLTDHLGHQPGERAEGGRENYRNGHRSKTVITESGPVEITVPQHALDISIGVVRLPWPPGWGHWRVRWPQPDVLAWPVPVCTAVVHPSPTSTSIRGGWQKALPADDREVLREVIDADVRQTHAFWRHR
ncbi:transposase [Streptomyces sp. NPDC127020]|uniref:transposase n=1 Tax=Streptomyces sp. NPDC127020 TaxID=3347109 RepID=UPI00365BAB30